jgi:integrase/recombinase XerD
MSFSCKIILADHKKLDNSKMVYLQAIIDRGRAQVPLGFYISDEHFDKRTRLIKSSHPNHDDFNTEIFQTIAKANKIASEFRQKGTLLTCQEFVKSFNDPTEKMDMIKFIGKELALNKHYSPNTIKQHQTIINKLKAFKKVILFNHVNHELIQKFKNHLINDGNGSATIEKLTKILKHYLSEARKKGIAVADFEIKIRAFKSHRGALTETEVKILHNYFIKADTPTKHKNVLRYFLFSCYTGLRISDIKVLTWQNIGADMLIYKPVKTKSKNEEVQVPLLKSDLEYLPAYTSDKALVFTTYAEPVINRYLKEIANAEGVKIKKNITYHTSRHTFASMMAEGGDVIALQRMMGHSDVKTSMGYVHTNTKQLVDAKTSRFGKMLKNED